MRLSLSAALQGASLHNILQPQGRKDVRYMAQEITIYSKKKQTKDGSRSFYSYYGRIKKKNGEELPVEVKFRESCTKPDGARCPMNIVINKEGSSLSKKEIVVEETGERKTVYKLWISAWQQGSVYEDHSMDDIDI